MCYYSGMTDVSKTIKNVLGGNANDPRNADLVRQLLVDVVSGNTKEYSLVVGNSTVPYKPQLQSK